MSYVVGSFTGSNGQIVVVQSNDSSLAYNASYVTRAERSCDGFTFPKDCDKIIISKLGSTRIQGQAYKDGDAVSVSREINGV